MKNTEDGLHCNYDVPQGSERAVAAANQTAQEHNLPDVTGARLVGEHKQTVSSRSYQFHGAGQRRSNRCGICNSSCSSCAGGIVKLKTSKAFHMWAGFDLEHG